DAPVLDERDVALPELELEERRMVRGAHQHGLVAQVDAALTVLEDALDDLARLVALVVGDHDLREGGSPPLGDELAAAAPVRLGGDLIREIEDRLGRAVV